MPGRGDRRRADRKRPRRHPARIPRGNRAGWLRWSRTCEVLAVEPPRRIAWRTIPTPLFVDSSDWRITLEPLALVPGSSETFAVTKCPHWWEWIVARFVPRHIDRSAALTDDLRRIAAVAARHATTLLRQHVSAISAAGTAPIHSIQRR